MSHEFVYYDEDQFSSSDEEIMDGGMTGGLRMTNYAQTGNNPRSIPYHMAETLGNPSAGGKLNMKKVGKAAKKNRKFCCQRSLERSQTHFD
jgi:hypothetical protein